MMVRSLGRESGVPHEGLRVIREREMKGRFYLVN
jgi:hypothetical protein